MSSENVLAVTDDSFETEVANADTPVLVDFWAEWCMPCKMIAPIIDALAVEYEGKVKVCSMDCDSNRDVPMRFGVSAIPTLVLLNGGQLVKKFVGMQQKADLKAAINDVLAQTPQ